MDNLLPWINVDAVAPAPPPVLVPPVPAQSLLLHCGRVPMIRLNVLTPRERSQRETHREDPQGDLRKWWNRAHSVETTRVTDATTLVDRICRH
jgi:hypothetical protein